ncbi:ROK family protein [Actinocatenispora rupis]|uniref:Glucokinase n=1 Tax=Actinocatenispora rupis TaxID=519421 RepID=A0A8J3IY16_9ACTN|nr:ROK family protein [Actinocatenispora rupis]GID10860.1 hypothetical protein Aru02nite_17490 [Actinocatenispora rupis]
MNTPAVPVLEIGGTHVTAALVEWRAAGPVVVDSGRTTLSSDGSADEIVGAIARAAGGLTAPTGAVWSVALPGPFDYAAGIALFAGVGKFEALYGVDLRAALCARIPAAADFRFVNDAEAFAIGEWAYGAGRGHDRAVAITLGTGVGSTFLRAGVAVRSGDAVPPQGRVDLLTHRGRPLEETVSRRAVIAAYAQRTGRAEDVREIATAARAGDAVAAGTLRSAFEELGVALAPWLTRFGAEVVVVGGAMVASWDLIEPALRAGLGADLAALPLAVAARPADSPLFGAALVARDPASPEPASPEPASPESGSAEPVSPESGSLEPASPEPVAGGGGGSPGPASPESGSVEPVSPGPAPSESGFVEPDSAGPAGRPDPATAPDAADPAGPHHDG